MKKMNYYEPNNLLYYDVWKENLTLRPVLYVEFWSRRMQFKQ
jgi:hypothetical protein